MNGDPEADIVQLNGEESESSCDELESHDGETTSVVLTKRMKRQFCLYDELSRIKSVLSSQRKRWIQFAILV